MSEVKIGQRWIRNDLFAGDIDIMEIIHEGPKGIRAGRIVQVIKGYGKVGQEDTWGFEDTSSVKYTYLEGQDRP